MSILELMTGVSLETIGAVLTASFFVAQCATAEVVQSRAETRRP